MIDEQLIFTPWTVFITYKEKNFRREDSKELEKERFSEKDYLKRRDSHCGMRKEASKVSGKTLDIFEFALFTITA